MKFIIPKLGELKVKFELHVTDLFIANGQNNKSFVINLWVPLLGLDVSLVKVPICLY